MPESWTTDEVAALFELCAHLGIATRYDDIWGTTRDVPHEALASLVSEFGILLSDELTPRRALEMAREASRRQSLPPVLPIRAERPEWRVTVLLPAEKEWLSWSIADEDGRIKEGQLRAHSFQERTRSEREDGAWCERELVFPESLPIGYHRLTMEGLQGETLIVSAPERCYRPEGLRKGARVFGPALQLYALKSKRNWGIGDFGDLLRLIPRMTELGASFIGLNPLHALFPHNPAHASPYSPSSRLHLNVLYLDVEAVVNFARCDAAQHLVASPAFQARLARLRETEVIDHIGVAAAKFEVLELVFRHFRKEHLSEDGRLATDKTGSAFLAFVTARGPSLYRHAVFEALQHQLHKVDATISGWTAWPEAYRHPEAPAVETFAREHPDEVLYHQYLQWLAAQQLSKASDLCRELGLPIGLYLDLAVSFDRAGSDAWSASDCLGAAARIGAPPDDFNLSGQDWGLPPLRPDRLRETGYRVFVDTLRANMRSAGALRIDHVMGLMRLFWIPKGHSAAGGAYIHYRMEEMLAIVALESVRHRCMVIGEDLGTVADEMRTALARFDILSYRLLYFERLEGGEFRKPSDYPESALVALNTHDLPPLAGWWAGHDLSVRHDLGLFPTEDVFAAQMLERARDRANLLLAVEEAGLLTAEAAAGLLDEKVLSPHAVEAIHGFVASTPCVLMAMNLEDPLGAIEQVNLPGTTDEQPNWRRKMILDTDELSRHPALVKVSRTLAASRPRPAPYAATSSPEATVPRATYRIQFHKDFGFDDAIRVLPYLSRLGVSHVYASPIQRARPESPHGYDIVAHAEINPELGGIEGFERFTEALRARGMGQILDVVPNHMGVFGADNAWWMDVLENGPASKYAGYFDIDWKPLNPELLGKVLLPVLGDHYGSVLQRGELILQFEAETGSLALHYFEHRFPLAPETYPLVLSRAEARVDGAEVRSRIASTSATFRHLPGRDALTSEARAERVRDKEFAKDRLRRLAIDHPIAALAIAAAVSDLNRERGRDDLHALIEAQAYRPAYWRVAADEINYRRFFDINDLAALRMESEDVFEATQSFALDQAARGAVDGLRIDHPDGLREPARYFQELQAGYARRVGLVLSGPDAEGRPDRPLYVVAEKIPASHEDVPTGWSIHGTTGYRFANLANGLLIDRAAGGRLEQIFRAFTGVRDTFAEISRAGKREIMRSSLASEMTLLSTELVRIARGSRQTRDYTLNALRRALASVTACLPVYRTYVSGGASEQDIKYINLAVREAEELSGDLDLSVFGFLRRTLLGQAEPDAPKALAERVRAFAIRFEQFSAPVAAKGIEDTAFYRYFPLLSLNEVGGEPEVFGTTIEDFHAQNAFRAELWPHTLLATSTHDSKLSEDVRCRIDVLSEMPARWRLSLKRWRALSRGLRQTLEAQGAREHTPVAAHEFLLYQTLLGTLPAGGLRPEMLEPFRERITRYMLKGAREAKLETRWTHPNEGYERALTGFVEGVLGKVEENPLLEDIQYLATEVAWFGALNSLTLNLLKFTSPGVPDIYQGQEVVRLALVDPDNRGPVDYDSLAKNLALVEALGPEQIPSLLDSPPDGLAKLWLVSRLLRLRTSNRDLFKDGGYQPLTTGGARAQHVVAFTRIRDGELLIVVAGRLFVGLLGEPRSPLGHQVWGDTTVAVQLPDGTRLMDQLTGVMLTVTRGCIEVGTAFSRFPAAVFSPLR
ncbi:MAG: malto-oligosyltrehalose synthase [Vicinamibacteria bacterium]